ncbi:MAG: hypothetical protein IPH20_20435 [Bacteroidales bacterium]|nr:hypothetical protein [Bacteroidales bacterium]
MKETPVDEVDSELLISDLQLWKIWENRYLTWNMPLSQAMEPCIQPWGSESFQNISTLRLLNKLTATPLPEY